MTFVIAFAIVSAVSVVGAFADIAVAAVTDAAGTFKCYGASGVLLYSVRTVLFGLSLSTRFKNHVISGLYVICCAAVRLKARNKSQKLSQ